MLQDMYERTLSPRLPVQLRRILRPLRRGSGDPSVRLSDSEAWRATRTPEGPATTHFTLDGTEIRVSAWGPGAEWAIDAAPDILGMNDDPSDFVPRHALIRDLHNRSGGMPIGRSKAIMEALVPTILEQKVTGLAAKRSYHALVRHHGEPAPGPGGLLLPPDPAKLAALPYYAFHPLGIERKRADTIRRASAVASKLDAALTLTPEQARRRLMTVPGVGPWTAAEVSLVAMGDPDAVSVGDYHLPNLICWALAGEPRGDDARMLELLEPYRGQRGRAIRLIESAGITAPRYGPRLAPISIARI
jgi:3-methyladenine DNA glycosylase/8-oxoguanine DNA glycosylase